MNYTYMYIICILIILLILYISSKKYNIEHFKLNKIAIAILCIKPDAVHLNFYNMFPDNYDIYFICDSAEPIDPLYDRIKIIQIKDRECLENKYVGSTTATIKKVPTSWDKAIYYFAEQNNSYNQVWFIEDDVFIPSIDTLINIDNKYVTSDLLVHDNIKNENGVMFLNGWDHWGHAANTISPPWFSSMACCIRVSNRLLYSIKKYVKQNNTLLFLELMFNTLAYHNNLDVVVIEELKHILWRNDWKLNDIDRKYIYHPIKDSKVHESYRKELM